MAWTGSVAASPPAAPQKTPAPVTAARRCGGYHWILAFISPISAPEMPMPVTKRPMPSQSGSAARAHRTKPSAATSDSVTWTGRGP